MMPDSPDTADTTETTEASPQADPAQAPDGTEPDGCERPWCGAQPLDASLPARPMMPVEWLTAHPGNVRGDLDLTGEFVASVAEDGVLVPLRITIDGDGDAQRYRVIDGHRRLAAAVKAGLPEVPYDLAVDRRSDEAGQYLDMFNAHRHRKGFTALEEADALFAASEAGATRTRIRKSTGLKPAQVKTALAAAGLDGQTRASADQVARERGDELSLADLAILAEFQDDPDALRRLMDSAAYHDSLEHQAERLRQERAEQAAHEKLRADLEAGGLTITDTQPLGALRLTFLTHEGEQLTPESHADCLGRGAFFNSWDLLNPVHYCTDPDRHRPPGETGLGEPTASASGDPAGPEIPTPAPAASPPAEDPEAAAARRRVVEGNRAWRAASEVRHRWLAGQLFARRSAPREVDVFIAGQLLTMPEALRRYLASAGTSAVFGEVTGKQPGQLTEACATAASRRLPLLMLAPIATAYEHALTKAAGSETTWRDYRFSPCPYADVGAYFTFLGSLGYQLSAIEQAVVDGTSWEPGTPLMQAHDGQPDDPGTGEDATGGEDVPQDADASQDASGISPDVPEEVPDADTTSEQAAA
jgi:ParB family chromosome partitioning protein